MRMSKVTRKAISEYTKSCIVVTIVCPQVHGGAGMPDIQCIVHNRSIFQLRQRNVILDGKFSFSFSRKLLFCSYVFYGTLFVVFLIVINKLCLSIFYKQNCLSRDYLSTFNNVKFENFL